MKRRTGIVAESDELNPTWLYERDGTGRRQGPKKARRATYRRGEDRIGGPRHS
jgi:hypothetical protein